MNHKRMDRGADFINSAQDWNRNELCGKGEAAEEDRTFPERRFLGCSQKMRQTVTEVERYQDTSIIPKAVCHGRTRMRVVHGIFLGISQQQ